MIAGNREINDYQPQEIVAGEPIDFQGASLPKKGKKMDSDNEEEHKN